MLDKIKKEIMDYKIPILVGAGIGFISTYLAFQFNLVTLQAIYTPSQFSILNDIVSTTTQVFTATKNQIYFGMSLIGGSLGYGLSKEGWFKK